MRSRDLSSSIPPVVINSCIALRCLSSSPCYSPGGVRGAQNHHSFSLPAATTNNCGVPSVWRASHSRMKEGLLPHHPSQLSSFFFITIIIMSNTAIFAVDVVFAGRRDGES